MEIFVNDIFSIVIQSLNIDLQNCSVEIDRFMLCKRFNENKKRHEHKDLNHRKTIQPHTKWKVQRKKLRNFSLLRFGIGVWFL